MCNKDSKKIIRQNEDSYQTKTFRVLKNVSAKKYSFRVEERKCGHLLIGVQTLSLLHKYTLTHTHTYTHSLFLSYFVLTLTNRRRLFKRQ